MIPWIGGVFEVHAWPDDREWRHGFVKSAAGLLRQHPGLAGVQVNIEPMADGHRGMLELLSELKQAMPAGKTLSIAAYPPPTVYQRVPEVHWSEEYIREISRIVDQMVFMMYDTSVQHEKLYIGLMKAWTRECLEVDCKHRNRGFVRVARL